MIITYRTEDINYFMIPESVKREDEVIWVRLGEPRLVPRYVLEDAQRLHKPVEWGQCIPINIDSTVRVNV